MLFWYRDNPKNIKMCLLSAPNSKQPASMGFAQWITVYISRIWLKHMSWDFILLLPPQPLAFFLSQLKYVLRIYFSPLFFKLRLCCSRDSKWILWNTAVTIITVKRVLFFYSCAISLGLWCYIEQFSITLPKKPGIFILSLQGPP